MKVLTSAFFLFFLFVLANAQSGPVKGFIKDSASGEIIPFANVILTGEGYAAETHTDMDGIFLIDSVTSGTFNLTVKWVGFETKVCAFTLKKGDSIALNILLKESENITRGGPILQYQEPLIDPDRSNEKITREDAMRGIVYGTILTSEINGMPLSGVNVCLKGTRFKTISQTNGYYEMDSVPPGEYTIEFSMPGKFTQSQTIKPEPYYSLWVYLQNSPFKDSSAYELIQEKLRNLNKDTILLGNAFTNNCKGGDSLAYFYESGNVRHMRKEGEWIGCWGNGVISYKASYKQKIKFRKTNVIRKVRGRDGFAAIAYKNKWRLRYWVIPSDSLIAYNFNGTKAYTLHFSKKGEITDSVICLFDSSGQGRLVRDQNTGEEKEYCAHGILIGDNPHTLECDDNCFSRLDYFTIVAPYELKIGQYIRAKF